MPVSCVLPKRGFLRIFGDDRLTFLQGLVSNDVALCRPGQPVYACLLTPQGKFLHDMFLTYHDDCYLIECESHRVDDLLRRLKKYTLRAKVTLETALNEFDICAVWGPGLTEVSPHKDPRLTSLGWRVTVKKGNSSPHGESVSESDYDRHRLSLGVPDGSRDMIIEKSTLLECNIDRLNGVSWSKGCYMGQELTARMYYRALVKKRLFPVKIVGHPPAFGSIVRSEGIDVGEMRSHQGDIGLALLNIEKTSTTTLECEDARLIVQHPSWMKV